MQLEVAALAAQKKLLALAAADDSHINATRWFKPITPLTSAFQFDICTCRCNDSLAHRMLILAVYLYAAFLPNAL